MLYPSPAVVTTPMFGDEPVFAEAIVETPAEGGGIRLSWDFGDESHALDVLSLDSVGGVVTGIVAGGRDFPVTIRALDPYDGVVLAPEAGIPQPVDVLEAQILAGGSMAAQELSAVVLPDNTVATLFLETGLGVYVRYMGDWQLLNPQSAAFENTEIVTVAPSALGVWDAADAAHTTLSVFDLPRTVAGEDLLPADVLPTAPAEDLPVAPGTAMPVIASAGDVAGAVAQGWRTPGIRWYVERRANALGVGDLIPRGWDWS